MGRESLVAETLEPVLAFSKLCEVWLSGQQVTLTRTNAPMPQCPNCSKTSVPQRLISAQYCTNAPPSAPISRNIAPTPQSNLCANAPTTQCNATPLQPGIREAARLLGLIVLSCKHVELSVPHALTLTLSLPLTLTPTLTPSLTPTLTRTRTLTLTR